IGQRLPRAGAAAPSLSDASLATLVKIKTLTSLKLGEAHFTPEALVALASLPQLTQLTFFETDLSAADIEKVRASLPKLKIEWQPLTEEQRKKFEQYLKQS